MNRNRRSIVLTDIDSIMDNCITVRLVRLIISVISLAARLSLWVTIRIPRTHQVVPYTQINIHTSTKEDVERSGVKSE